jgi:small subunit ribosomal protein S9
MATATSAIQVKKLEKKEKQVERFYATGRRKTASARVWISRGNGKIIINGRDVAEYFPLPENRYQVNKPFALTKTAGEYDVFCTVKGSGTTGQAGAILLGISRALTEAVPDLRTELRKNDCLRCDSRRVERKKFGYKKARKSFQFSKR